MNTIVLGGALLLYVGLQAFVVCAVYFSTKFMYHKMIVHDMKKEAYKHG